MKDYLRKNGIRVGIILAAVVLIIGFGSAARAGRISAVQNARGILSAPLQKVLSSAANWFDTIYGYLYDSFYKFIYTYIEKKKGKRAVENEDNRFLIICAASAACGLVIKELKKEKCDYEDVLNHISRGFKSIPNVK